MQHVADETHRHLKWFFFACGFEAALLAAAAGLSLILHQPLWSNLHASLRHFLVGLVGSLPLFLVLNLVLNSNQSCLKPITSFLERVVRPFFQTWTWSELAVLSLIAGVSEEVLFRSLIQNSLAQWLGMSPALLLTGLIFGLMHLVNWPYAVVASIIGLYLGGLWWWSGNLLCPITAHAFYDFVALVYYLKFRRQGTQPGMNTPKEEAD